MFDVLRRDYAAMTGIIFGDVSPFDYVVATVHDLEWQLNA